MTPAELSVLRLINHSFPDEGRLLDDPDSFVEMDQGVVHISSTKYGEHYFRIIVCPCDESEYFKSIWIDCDGNHVE